MINATCLYIAHVVSTQCLNDTDFHFVSLYARKAVMNAVLAQRLQ